MFIIEALYNLKKKIKKLYKDYFTVEGTYTSLLPDRIYIKKLYKKRMGKELDLKNPITYTEKLNWLKVYDRKPLYTVMADKYEVRKYIAEKIGEEYLVPLLGIWNDINEMDFSILPKKFVLKCNHDNGVIICQDKEQLDIANVKKELSYHINRNYYKKAREWPYKNIKRKVLCEKFMENNNGEKLVDYKVFCFNGEPKIIMVNSNRLEDGGVKTDIYDIEWKYLEMKNGHYPKAGDIFDKPNCLEEMLRIARLLSENIPFIRVDFNYWNNRLYFGELTFYHAAGLESFLPKQWDYVLGEWLKLPV